MNTRPALDSRVACLADEVSDFRDELGKLVATLRDVGYPEGVLDVMMRLALRLTSRLYEAAGRAPGSDNLFERVETAAREGLLPDEMGSYLHLIRVLSNKPHHDQEKVALQVADAENVLGAFLRVLEWFFCECSLGPHLPAMYTDSHRQVTLQDRLEQLQQASAEDTRSLQAAIALLAESLHQAGQSAEEEGREPIPIPLPALRGAFVDRELERDTLHHLLREGEMRVVVIVAPGGYGKTELTAKILCEVAPSTTILAPDVQGILYLRCLRGDVDLGFIFAQAGRIAGQAERFQQVYARDDLPLGRKMDFLFHELTDIGNVWVVMDNFEDLLDERDRIVDPELREFVEAAIGKQHSVRLIATTRAVPRFEGSHRVSPVDLGEGLPEDQAVLYMRAEGAAYGLSEADEELLRAFVRRVHCIPKALESAIGYLSERYPVVQLRDLMANDALFTDFDQYDMENGLRHLIAEQFHDQSAEAQLVLCALSVFRKATPLAALRYLLPALDWMTVLPRLERSRLVSRRGDYYDLHPLVREYAYEQIPAQEDGSMETPFSRPALHTRAAAFYRELHLPRDHWQTIADLEPQLDGFHHLVRAGHFDDACSLLNEIDDCYLSLWGHYALLSELRAQLVDRLLDEGLQEGNWGYWGLALRGLGDARKAVDCLEHALALARQTGHQENTGLWLGNLGRAHAGLGDMPTAMAYYQRAIEVARAIGDRCQEGMWLGALGRLHADLGEIRQALQYEQQALEIADQTGDTRSQASHLGNLGVAYYLLRQVDKAIECYDRALLVARSLGDRLGEAVHLGNLGLACLRVGDLNRAIDCRQRALSIEREIGARHNESVSLGDMARLHLAFDRTGCAVGCLEEALAIARSIGDRRRQARHRCDLGLALFRAGNVPEAIAQYEEALSLSRETTDPVTGSTSSIGLGEICHRLDDLAEARRWYEDALRFDMPRNNYMAATKLGVLCLQEGEFHEAQQFLTRGASLCQQLLDATPRFYDALYCLGLAQLGAGEPDQALGTYREAIAVCAARGVVNGALQDLRLLESARRPVPRLAEAIGLLGQSSRLSGDDSLEQSGSTPASTNRAGDAASERRAEGEGGEPRPQSPADDAEK